MPRRKKKTDFFHNGSFLPGDTGLGLFAASGIEQGFITLRPNNRCGGVENIVLLLKKVKESETRRLLFLLLLLVVVQ